MMIFVTSKHLTEPEFGELHFCMLGTKSRLACQISGQTPRLGGNTGQEIHNRPRMTGTVGNYTAW